MLDRHVARSPDEAERVDGPPAVDDDHGEGDVLGRPEGDGRLDPGVLGRAEVGRDVGDEGVDGEAEDDEPEEVLQVKLEVRSSEHTRTLEANK